MTQTQFDEMHPLEHRGQHFDSGCDECVDYERSWSSAGGSNSTWLQVISDLRDRAGKAFIMGDDQRAKELRAIAISYELGPAAEASKLLNFFINSRKRT